MITLDSKEFFKRKLKRLYDEINYAQQRNDYASADGFLYWANQAAAMAQSLFPENEWIQGIKDAVPGYHGSPSSASADLTTIKLGLLDLMDALEINFEEIRKVESFQPTIFNISQSQSASQVNFQSLDNMISTANNLSLAAEVKEEITRLLNEYKKETESKNPNESKIKSILSKVHTMSKEVGIPLFTHAVQSGYLTDLF